MLNSFINLTEEQETQLSIWGQRTHKVKNSKQLRQHVFAVLEAISDQNDDLTPTVEIRVNKQFYNEADITRLNLVVQEQEQKSGGSKDIYWLQVNIPQDRVEEFIQCFSSTEMVIRPAESTTSRVMGPVVTETTETTINSSVAETRDESTLVSSVLSEPVVVDLSSDSGSVYESVTAEDMPY